MNMKKSKESMTPSPQTIIDTFNSQLMSKKKTIEEVPPHTELGRELVYTLKLNFGFNSQPQRVKI